jgi:hypothetical protein
MKYIKTYEQKVITKLNLSDKGLTSLPELPDSLEQLGCSENNLPYNNLKEYKEWVINNKKLIDEYGWIKAHEISCKMKKYNL